MKRFFALYQYLGPALLTPLAAWLWWRHYDGNVHLAALALAVPVIHAYVVPGIGTNVLGMWSFNTRLRLGRFRPHHGFVFGSASAILVLPVMGAPDPAATPSMMAGTALVAGAVLLAVNWIYDALALRHGYLEVYNQPWADGAGPWAVSADYVVWFFGLFGVIYGGGLRYAESVLLADPDPIQTVAIAAVLVAATITLPTLCYIAASRIRHGHYGLRPVHAATPETPSR